MKKPFDRIIGPEGEWIDGDDSEKPEVVDENGLSEREEFAFRCMNAAANLYGVVTFTEMTLSSMISEIGVTGSERSRSRAVTTPSSLFF